MKSVYWQSIPGTCYYVLVLKRIVVVCVCARATFFSNLTDRASTIRSNLRGINPIRRLLDRKRSQKKLQSSNECIKTKQVMIG